MRSVAAALTVAVAAALAIVPAGCGGSGGPSGPTKAEFIKRADAICSQVGKKQAEARHTFWVGHPGVLGTKQFVEEELGWRTDVVEAAVLPPVQVEAEELDRLRTPSGDWKEVKTIIAGIEKAVRKAERHPIPLIKKNAVGPFGPVEKLAREYGFRACAEPL